MHFGTVLVKASPYDDASKHFVHATVSYNFMRIYRYSIDAKDRVEPRIFDLTRK